MFRQRRAGFSWWRSRTSRLQSLYLLIPRLLLAQGVALAVGQTDGRKAVRLNLTTSQCRQTPFARNNVFCPSRKRAFAHSHSSLRLRHGKRQCNVGAELCGRRRVTRKDSNPSTAPHGPTFYLFPAVLSRGLSQGRTEKIPITPSWNSQVETGAIRQAND
jgi:hypothetical protein